MTNSDLSLNILLDLTLAVPKFKLTDTTTAYTNEGIPLSRVYEVFRITAPTGDIWENTDYSAPDIHGNVSLEFNTVTIPTYEGEPYTGAYTVVQTVYIIDGINPIQTYTKTHTFTYNFTVPTGEVNISINGYASTLVATDDTTYGTYVTLTRSLTLTVPVGSGLSDQTTTGASISVGPNIWSGEYLLTLASTVTYQKTGHQIKITIAATDTDDAYLIDMEEIQVDLETFKDTYLTAVGANIKLANTYQAYWDKIDIYLNLYDLALFYQVSQDAYDNALAVVLILNSAGVDVIGATEEIPPFTDYTSFINTDERVKINASDATAGYLMDKLFADHFIVEGGYVKIDPAGLPSLSDYVSQSLGGSFDALISYTTQLTITGNTTLTTKKYVDDLIAALNLAGKIGLTDLSIAAGVSPLSYANTTGIFTLNKNLSAYTNDAGFITSITEEMLPSHSHTTSDITDIASYASFTSYYTKTNLQTSGQASVHWGNLTNVPSYQTLDATLTALAALTTSANTLILCTGADTFSVGTLTNSYVHASAAIDWSKISKTGSNLTDLTTKNHNDLSNISGGAAADYYHLTSAQHTLATQYATGSISGILNTTDWVIFNAKATIDDTSSSPSKTYSSEKIDSLKSQYKTTDVTHEIDLDTVAIGDSVTLTPVDTGLAWTAGSYWKVTDTDDYTNYVAGEITSYDGTDIIFTVSFKGGSGTIGNPTTTGLTMNLPGALTEIFSSSYTADKFIIYNGTTEKIASSSYDYTSFVLTAGSIMTGLLTLSGAPTSDLHACTKKYADDLFDEVLNSSIDWSAQTFDDETGLTTANLGVDGFYSYDSNFIYFKHSTGKWIRGAQIVKW